MDAATDGILAVSPRGELLGHNLRFEEVFGLSAGSLRSGEALEEIVRRVSNWVDPDQRGDFESELLKPRTIGPGPEKIRPRSFSLVDGRRVTVYTKAAFGESDEYRGRIWFFRDDADLLTSEAQHAELLVRLKASERFQGYLLRAMNALAGASGYIETVDKLAQVALPVLGDMFVLDVVDERDRPDRIVVRHSDPSLQSAADRLLSEFAPDPEGLEPSVQVIRTGRTRWSAEMSESFLRATTRNEAHFKLIRELGFTSYMCVPLFEGDRILGAVTLVSGSSGRRFGEEDVALMEVLADPIAQVVSRGLRYDKQHGIARTLQESLLPQSMPVVPGLKVAARYVAGTREAEVGGDFYDMIRFPNGVVGMMVGDVAGHDTSSAAAMGQVRSASRALAGQVSTPSELVDVMRSSWDMIGVEQMTTVVYCRLEVPSGALCLASAGHPPPVIVRTGADGENESIVVDCEPAPPFGIPAETVPQNSSSEGDADTLSSSGVSAQAPDDLPRAIGWAEHLLPGDALVLYTDGLVERRNRPVQDGIAALSKQAAASWNGDPDDLCDAIISNLIEPGGPSDDVALLIVSIEDGAS